MNEQFETLPFAAGEMEWEEERGRIGGRPMGRPVYRAGARPGKGPVTRPAPRPASWPGIPRWPRGPYWGPFYGGGGVMVSEPFGYPVPVAVEPQSGDDGDAAFEPADFPAQGELPPTIAATIGRLPAGDRPAYVALGPILTARRDPRATGAGFYLIEFMADGRQRAYSGETDNLRRRLQQHILCGTMMGLPLANHRVYVAQSRLADGPRRAIEYRIHDDMFRNSPGVLTNQRRELELEVLGW